MIYAIVTEYADGHTVIEYINNKAREANKVDCQLCITFCDDTIDFEYVTRPDYENRPEIVHTAHYGICLERVLSISVHNVCEDMSVDSFPLCTPFIASEPDETV